MSNHGGRMTNKNKTKFPPLFPKIPQVEDVIMKKSIGSDYLESKSKKPLDHRYQNQNSSTILFLSKRGMSRSPLAREVLREQISQSPFFGKCQVTSRGVTKAYDHCPIDGNLRTYADKIGYFLQGYSRFATVPDLAQADLIIPLDHESEDFTRVYHTSIIGIVRPFGIFLPTGSLPFLDDPYERNDGTDASDIYDQIVLSLKLGCSKILKAIPSLIA